MNPTSHAASDALQPGPQTADPVGVEPTDPLIAGLLERAASLEGDSEGLLSLLRAIEAAHRSIQDGPFRNSLPADRNRLFALLADMERSGGWPYIPRLQLRTFMDLLQPEERRSGELVTPTTRDDEASGQGPGSHQQDEPLAA
ncbi:MAG: hypothetical protein VKK62_10900 [Synechococcaceae cyanobacterium]|nr:hypothetical protein [Synechococcaceae cyanobacterium]